MLSQESGVQDEEIENKHQMNSEILEFVSNCLQCQVIRLFQ